MRVGARARVLMFIRTRNAHMLVLSMHTPTHSHTRTHTRAHTRAYHTRTRTHTHVHITHPNTHTTHLWWEKRGSGA